MREPARLLSSFGRRRGRKLRPSRQGLMENLLPNISISLPPKGMLDLAAVFKQKEYWLEIGFGGGEHLAHQAAAHPEAGIIGCEPFINGTAALLARIESEKLSNIRIYGGDARLLIGKLPDGCLTKVFILYPDPWPKARHHKRRLISKEFLDALARVMKPGADLRLATDDEDYCTWMLERLLPHGRYVWQAEKCSDWLTPWPDWISTRYEQKALKAGRVPTYLTFMRR